MPDDLYERDALAWSEQQADLLRRLARGERVNDVDWEHVVEEIEDVGRSELHAVESFLELIFVHLLKLHRWPDSHARRHWQSEIRAFQTRAGRRFSPSMRQKIDLAGIYRGALGQTDVSEFDGNTGMAAPEACPVTLDQLLHSDVAELDAAFAAA